MYMIRISVLVLLTICADGLHSGPPGIRELLLKQKPKQLSFALPGLNLLNNNNQGGVGGLFGGTVTKTIVRTVSTVNVLGYRTCTTYVAALSMTPCAGRRRRDADEVVPSPVVVIKIDNTQISDPAEVAAFLEDHKPGPSVIYPKGVDPKMVLKLEAEEKNQEQTTILPLDSSMRVDTVSDDVIDEIVATTTETPSLPQDDEGETTTIVVEDDIKGRLGFSGTTITSTISVTSIQTTYATGMGASTFTISYAGCFPTAFPFIGMSCGP